MQEEGSTGSEVLSAFISEWQHWLERGELFDALATYREKASAAGSDTDSERERCWLAADWLARKFTPTFLRTAGPLVLEHANALEALPALTDFASYNAAVEHLEAALYQIQFVGWEAPGIGAERDNPDWEAMWDAANSAVGGAASLAFRDSAANVAAELLADPVLAEHPTEGAAIEAGEGMLGNISFAAVFAAAWQAPGTEVWDSAWARASEAADVGARRLLQRLTGRRVEPAKNDFAEAWLWATDKSFRSLEPTIQEAQESALALLDEMIAVGAER